MTDATDTLMGIFGFKRVDIKMEDDKLIQLAAKAAGIVLAYGRDVTEIHPSSVHYLSAPYWEPLTDDGDALRLAVKLRIGILQCQEGVEAVMPGGRRIEGWGGNREEATRRAIVRAAAAIGEAMRD